MSWLNWRNIFARVLVEICSSLNLFCSFPKLNRCGYHWIFPVLQVSCMKQGLLPLTQEALLIGKTCYHDYCGILVNDAEKESIGRNLGPTNRVMFLRNHGVVVCTSTIESAWSLMHLVVTACEIQVRSAPAFSALQRPSLFVWNSLVSSAWVSLFFITGCRGWCNKSWGDEMPGENWNGDV